MTREDLFDWIRVHKCTIEPLPEDTRGNVIKIYSKHTNRYIYFDTPINNKQVTDYSVCKQCCELGIPIPDECKHMEGLTDQIKKKHYPDY